MNEFFLLQADMIFQISALIIMLLFYGCYFIKAACQRKSGIRTDFLGKEKQGFTKFIEISLKISACAVPAAEAVSIYMNISYLPVWARYAGMGTAAAGLFFFISAVLVMRSSWRAGVSKSEKTELVTSGVFRISRNPAFLGFDLVYIGIALMFFNLTLYILTAISVILLHMQIINNEEPFLIEAFGEEYLKYKRKVNRYIGRKKV